MRKILIINTAGLAIGGITTNMFNYLSNINRELFVIDVVVTDLRDEPSINAFKNLGCNIIFLTSRTQTPIRYFNELRKLVKNRKYDVIHIHGSSHTVVIDLLASYVGGYGKRIVHAHSTRCNSIAIHRILFPLFNILYDKGFACSIEAGKFMFNNKPYEVLNNGIDLEKYSFNEKIRERIRHQMSLADEDVLIGHVGFFSELKNQSFIIDILTILSKKHPTYKLVLIGDGDLKTTIEHKVNQLGLSNIVFFTGNISNVSEYLNAIDIVVMPSLFEGLPLTLIEQQANGLVCVLSDTISKEADKTGYLKYLPLDKGPEIWADELLKVDLNVSRRDRSENAQKCIRECGYSIKEEAFKLQYVYQKL